MFVNIVEMKLDVITSMKLDVITSMRILNTISYSIDDIYLLNKYINDIRPTIKLSIVTYFQMLYYYLEIFVVIY